MAGEDEILEDEDEENYEENGADESEETGEAIEDYEELVINFVNYGWIAHHDVFAYFDFVTSVVTDIMSWLKFQCN